MFWLVKKFYNLNYKMQFKLNFKHSPIDTRDHILNITKTTVSQPIVDLSNFCSSVKNQGSVGSCTAHSGVALMEFFYRKFFGGKEQDLFSEKFLYYATRVNIAGWSGDDDSGAYVRDTMKCMVKYGVALESNFPYLKNGETECLYSEVPSLSIYQEAMKFQIVSYANIPETDRNKCLKDLKILLEAGYTFIGGFACYENIFNSIGGNIPLPSGQVIGGHAVLFVGYDDNKQVFKFKNSWGNWGDNGYGYLPYQYLLSGNMFDFWTVYQQEYNNQVFGIIKPKTRTDEFKLRLNEIMKSFIDEKDISIILNEIKNSPKNGEIYMGDIRELTMFAQRLHSLITTSKNTSAKLRS